MVSRCLQPTHLPVEPVLPSGSVTNACSREPNMSFLDFLVATGETLFSTRFNINFVLLMQGNRGKRLREPRYESSEIVSQLFWRNIPGILSVESIAAVNRVLERLKQQPLSRLTGCVSWW